MSDDLNSPVRQPEDQPLLLMNEQIHEPMASSLPDQAEETRGNQLGLKIGATAGAAVLLGAGALFMLRGESNISPNNEDIQTTSTSLEIGNEELSLREMLEAYVDKDGMPNRRINLNSDDPKEFALITNHNTACAINTRSPSCSIDDYHPDAYDANYLAVEGAINRYRDKDMFLKIDINEIVSVSTNDNGQIEVVEDATWNYLTRRADPYLKGWNDERYLMKKTLEYRPDGSLGLLYEDALEVIG